MKNPYEAKLNDYRNNLFFRSSLIYVLANQGGKDVATHILGCYKGKVIEVIDIKNRYIEPSGEYAGRKVFEGAELSDSPYIGMDLHEIFDSLRKFRVKYWNI
ncbi:MAG: hypothetical protein HDR82_08305 [Bacteroides sp.]|nr:hypothetical protein [Bacteroides sp.]